jgi:putative SOS response-associated peptidase YedK
MCGRYSLTTPVEGIRDLFDFVERLNLAPRWNIAPTQEAPVVRRDAEGGRHLVMLRWGLIPSWAKDATIASRCINARSESVAEKPAFRSALRHRRCLVPADGYYEWRASGRMKQPYRIVAEDGGPFAFAGLWEMWNGPEGPVETFAFMTTSPSADVSGIHDRMPVILEPTDYELWLDPNPVQWERQLTLLRPSAAGRLHGFPISTRINSPKYDDADCIVPISEAAPRLL